jgi:hypothetical protein
MAKESETSPSLYPNWWILKPLKIYGSFQMAIWCLSEFFGSASSYEGIETCIEGLEYMNAIYRYSPVQYRRLIISLCKYLIIPDFVCIRTESHYLECVFSWGFGQTIDTDSTLINLENYSSSQAFSRYSQHIYLHTFDIFNYNWKMNY